MVKMEINKVVGNRIRQIRIEKKMSQEELATKAKTTRPHISKIEGGILSLQIDTLQRVADALGVQIKELIEQ